MAIRFHDLDDIKKFRPNIDDLGVTDWDEHLELAEEKVLRIVEAHWYRERAEEYGLDWRTTAFDPDLLITESQLRDACCYKSLQLIYTYLQLDVPETEDAFGNMSKKFQALYKSEIREVLNTGLDYDWDGSGAGGVEPKSTAPHRPARAET